MVAPGTAAPVESVTIPDMRPSPCARAVEAVQRVKAQIRAKSKIDFERRSMKPPKDQPRDRVVCRRAQLPDGVRNSRGFQALAARCLVLEGKDPYSLGLVAENARVVP